MPKINFLIILVAAIIPMILGMLWYSNTLFGKAWMKAAEVTEEKLRATLELGKIYDFKITLFEPKDQRMTLSYAGEKK